MAHVAYQTGVFNAPPLRESTQYRFIIDRSNRIMPLVRSHHADHEVVRDVGRNAPPVLLTRTPAIITKEMLRKLEHAELGPKTIRFCGHEFNTRQVSILMALTLLFLLSSSIAYVFWQTQIYYDAMLNFIVISNTSAVYQSFVNPAPMRVRVHIYNYTNHDAVAQGKADKFKIQELGPYTYEDRMRRVNVSVSADGTSVFFREQHTYTFLANESRGRTEGERVTVPNIPLLAAAAIFRRSFFLTRVGMSAMFKQLEQRPFVQLPVGRFVLGYDDELIALARGMMALSRPLPFEQFGLLATRTGISRHRLEVHTGVGDLRRAGIVRSVDGRPSPLGGAGGVQQPPKRIQRARPVDVYVPDVCATLPLVYERDARILAATIPTKRYVTPTHAPFGATTPCTDDGDCPPPGLLSVADCAFGSPLLVSLPHFLGADPALRHAVDGVTPPRHQLHQTYVDYHPVMGFAMQGWTRLQTNVQVKKSFGITELGTFKDDAILPVAWMEFGGRIEDLTPDVLQVIYDATFLVNGIDMAFRFGSLLMMAVTLVSIGLVVHRNKLTRVDHVMELNVS